MKKIFIALAAASVLIAGFANATELTLKTAEKYYAALNMKGSFKVMVDHVCNQMLNSMYVNVSQELKRKRLNEADIKVYMRVIQTNVFDVKNSMMMNIDQLIPMNKMIPEIYYPVLKKHFSEEEIVELTTFYNSPLGKKTVTEMPAVTQESAQLLGQSPNYFPVLQKFLSDEMEKRKGIIKKEIDTEIARTRKTQKKTTK